MTITRDDNDVTNHTSIVYAKNEIKLSWFIGSSAIYDQNQTGQQHDRRYRCCLYYKQNWVVMTDQTECSLRWKPDRTTMWLIIQMWSMEKNEIELSWSIKLGVVYNENQIRQRRGWKYKCGLSPKWNWVIMTGWTRCCLWRKPYRITMWLFV